MAPEILNAKFLEKTYDFPVDIWSLGIISLVLFYDKDPYETSTLDPNSSELRKLIKQGKYSMKSEKPVQPAIRTLIKKMLIFSDEDRIDINTVLEEWKKI